MLKNIPKILSPNLLKVLCEMGHGDEIVIADGNFPSETIGRNNRVIRMDGHNATQVLNAILQLFPLDENVEKYAFVMKTDDDSVPTVWSSFESELENKGYCKQICQIERNNFYEKAKNAYCVIATGESALYANIILRKGTV